MKVSNGYDIWHGSGLLRDNDRINDGIAAQFLKSVLEQVLRQCEQTLDQIHENISGI